MGSLIEADRSRARRKGLVAAAVAGGSLFVALTASPFLGVLGLAGAGYLTYDWFRFRAKRGMRF